VHPLASNLLLGGVKPADVAGDRALQNGSGLNLSFVSLHRERAADGLTLGMTQKPKTAMKTVCSDMPRSGQNDATQALRQRRG